MQLPQKAEMDHVPVKYQDKDGAWRVRLVSHRKALTDEQKEVYLTELAEHGRTGHAATKANTTSFTISRERKSDADFEEAVQTALSIYKDRVIEHHQDLVFNGTTRTSYDRVGNVVSEEKIYPIRLIELELKKVDEGYREKRDIDVKVSGGVLIAPAELGTIEEWEAKFNGTTIEGECTEVSDKQDPSSDPTP